MDESPNESSGRSKRVSSSKQKKRELLEKLHSGRNKYEVGELDNVYEVVDEKEYTKKVLQRQDDDWIVDDGGCGYVEDGREIFDDDLDEESISKSKNVKSSKKRPRDIGPEEKKGGGLKKMLMGMPSKKKKEAVKIEEDDVLGDIIGELGDNSLNSSPSLSQSKQRELSAKEYLNSLSSSKLKPKPISRSLLSESSKRNSVETVERPKEPLDVKPKPLQRKVYSEQILPKDKNEKSTEGDSVILPVKIKEEPIDVDYCADDFSETFGEEFDDADVLAAENTVKQIKVEEVAEEPVPVKVKEEPPSLEFSTDVWSNQGQENDANAMNVVVDRNVLPVDSDGALSYYYVDSHEEITQPGVVYLFGKVKHPTNQSYISCCVVVRNIERQVFFLPRTKKYNLSSGTETDEDVTLTDVYKEFNSVVAPKYKILEFKSKKVTKKYAFGKEEIPAESEYLEIRYSANSRALPSDLVGETFSHVFGCRTSFLEIFFLECGIKGPGWLKISQAELNKAPCSWCKMEASCRSPSNVSVDKMNSSRPPPLVLMTIVPQAAYDNLSKQTEVVAIACVVNTEYHIDKPSEKLFNQHFCLLTKPSDATWPFDVKEASMNFNKTNVLRVDSERALLSCFLTKLFLIDADIIVGHDLSGFGIELLVARLSQRKIPNWSRLGRLRRANIPAIKIKSQIEKLAVSGRLMADIKISAKELIRSRSYDLSQLCINVLNFPEDKRPEMSDDDFKYAYNCGASLYQSLWNLMSDASYILRIFVELNVLPLALQITNIAGNVLSRTLLGGRSERNEFLLLHAFNAKGYILPDKEYKKKEEDAKTDALEGRTGKSSRKKPTYAGGLVLDPKVGFYDDLILLMDFNSLYPSIIQEFNICFSTVPLCRLTVDDNFLERFEQFLPDESAEKGILPTEIRKLVESRRDVKKMLKSPNLSPELKMQYDIRQMALKLTANSMYGCLGFTYSRFYAKELAAMITAKGREILMSTKRVVEGYGYDVIYGDTDSIMINTKVKDYEQVYTIGRKIKAEVNKFYKQVELDIDGVFKYMLLLRKKKYAAVTLTKLPSGQLLEKSEMKGLDIVRRDWSQLAGAAGKFVLKQILSNNSCDDKIDSIHSYLETIRQDLEEGKIPLSLLEVTKQLTKSPEEYADAKSLPHVQVALRMNTTSKRFKRGDTVSYITCVDGTSNPATQRSYHGDELKTNPKLKVDVEYYLSQQIHPVIARICDPIDGVDAASIARCLGMDPAKYKRSVRENTDELDSKEDLFGKDDETRFKECVRFSFRCEKCRTKNVMEGPVRPGQKEPLLETCVNAECKARPVEFINSIQNQLHLKVREMMLDVHKAVLVCVDPLCGFETTYVNPILEEFNPQCLKCKRYRMNSDVSPAELYNQLIFFTKTFDLSRVTSRVAKFDPETVAAYTKLHDQVRKFVNANNYSVVNMGLLFGQLMK